MAWGKKNKIAKVIPVEDDDIETDEEEEEETSEEESDAQEELRKAKEELAKLKANKVPEVKVVKKSCKIVGGEQIGENSFRFILLSNTSIGEIGDEFEL